MKGSKHLFFAVLVSQVNLARSLAERIPIDPVCFCTSPPAGINKGTLAT